MDYDALIAAVFAFLGGGVAKAAIDGWNARRLKQLDLVEKEQDHDNKLEEDAVTVLRQTLDDERSEHKDCLRRVSVLETELVTLRAENRELRKTVDTMRDALLKQFLGDAEGAAKLISSIRPSRPS